MIQRRPTFNECLQRAQMGAMMGMTVGGCMGLLFGGFSALKYGHGGKGYFKMIGKMMLQSGGTFGVFLGVGSVIRCEDDN